MEGEGEGGGWSKFVVHVPLLLFSLTEEQTEILYRLIEYNICSKSDYFIGLYR